MKKILTIIIFAISINCFSGNSSAITRFQNATQRIASLMRYLQNNTSKALDSLAESSITLLSPQTQIQLFRKKFDNLNARELSIKLENLCADRKSPNIEPTVVVLRMINRNFSPNSIDQLAIMHLQQKFEMGAPRKGESEYVREIKNIIRANWPIDVCMSVGLRFHDESHPSFRHLNEMQSITNKRKELNEILSQSPELNLNEDLQKLIAAEVEANQELRLAISNAQTITPKVVRIEPNYNETLQTILNTQGLLNNTELLQEIDKITSEIEYKIIIDGGQYKDCTSAISENVLNLLGEIFNSIICTHDENLTVCIKHRMNRWLNRKTNYSKSKALNKTSN